MQVVSGHVGRERVHFEGPEPERVPGEMSAFLEWFNSPPETDGVIRAATAHLWFVAVHPFQDGNGRIAQAITDMALAQSQSSPMRLYSVSHRILRERDAYYHALENATKGTCDITAWLSWFAGCLGRAMDDALEALSVAEQNAALGERAGQLPLNHRQLRVLELLIREPEETLTATRWARTNRSTREEAEADVDGMVRTCSWRNRPGRTSIPHAGSHTAGDGEGRRNTGAPDITSYSPGRTAKSPDGTAKSPDINRLRTAPQEPPEAPIKNRRKPPSGPKIGSPERDTGTAQDRRSERGETGPENTRFGAENREFSGPPEFDKKLHRFTANLASIS